MFVDPKAIPEADWQALIQAWGPYSELATRPQRFYETIKPVDPLTVERSFDAEEGLMALYKGKTDEGEGWKAFLRRDGEEHLSIRIELGELPLWKTYEVECGVGTPETRSFTEEHAKVGDLWISLNEPWSVKSRTRKEANELQASPRFLRAVAARIAEQFAGECGAMALRARRAQVGTLLIDVAGRRETALNAASQLEVHEGALSKALKRLPTSLKHLRGRPVEELAAEVDYFVDGPLGVLAMIPSIEGDVVAVRTTKRPSQVPSIGRIVLPWSVDEVRVTRDGRTDVDTFSKCSPEAGTKALVEAVSGFVKENRGCFQRAEISALAANVLKARGAVEDADEWLRKKVTDLGCAIERLVETEEAVKEIPGGGVEEIPVLPRSGMAVTKGRMLW